jgi:hypothetical protein
MYPTPNTGSDFLAACLPQIFGRPSELNLSIVQFLPSRVFNSNDSLQFCVCPMLISCHDKWEAKCRQSGNPKLSVSLFCFSPNPNGFSLDRSKISLKSPIFPPDKTFSK